MQKSCLTYTQANDMWFSKATYRKIIVGSHTISPVNKVFGIDLDTWTALNAIAASLLHLERLRQS